MPSARKRERNRLEAEIRSRSSSTMALDMWDYLDSGKEPQIVCGAPTVDTAVSMLKVDGLYIQPNVKIAFGKHSFRVACVDVWSIMHGHSDNIIAIIVSDIGPGGNILANKMRPFMDKVRAQVAVVAKAQMKEAERVVAEYRAKNGKAIRHGFLRLAQETFRKIPSRQQIDPAFVAKMISLCSEMPSEMKYLLDFCVRTAPAYAPFIDASTVQEAMDLTSVKEVMDQ